MLSVDAAQERLTVVPTTVAERLEGVLGGLVSAIVACASFEGPDDVAGGVLGGHLVVVGAGGEAAVAVARPGRLGDPVCRAVGVKPALVPR